MIVIFKKIASYILRQDVFNLYEVIFLVVGYIKTERLDRKIFSKLEIRNFDDNYVIAIDKNYKTKTKKRLVRYIKKLNIDTLVFSKELDGEFKEEICNMLLNYNVDILNGKRLMNFMKLEIVKYVLDKQNKNMKNEDIYIIFKKNEKMDFENLKEFIENFRMTNIVTNDLNRMKNIQENLLENDGILISVSNNKKKALKRAKYILNINLTKEELSKYYINRNAIIINIKENVKYDILNFDGININYFGIKCPDELIEKFEQIGENFDFVKLYESILLMENVNKINKEKIIEKIKKDEITISEILGNNGKILDEELCT